MHTMAEDESELLDMLNSQSTYISLYFSVVSRAIPVPASDDMTNVAEALREIPGRKSKDPLLTPGESRL